MSDFARKILTSRTVTDGSGRESPLDSETGLEQGEFLAALQIERGVQTSLEVGLAYGISALFTCDALMRNGKNGRFIAIDPFQESHYRSIGLLNLQRAGFERMVEYHQKCSHTVLPQLLDSAVELDFAYVDSTKVFDVLLVDAYYISRLLRVGGLLALDDCAGWPGPIRLARYIARWPHFRVHAVHGRYHSAYARRLISAIAPYVPKSNLLFSEAVLQPADSLGVNGKCVVFEKIAEDTRPWKWYESF